MRKFVLVGTQRSGTTYIRQCLNSHEDILCHGEIFLKNYPGEVGYFKSIKGQCCHTFLHAFMRPLQVRKYLDYYYSQSDYQATGFKLMYSQVRWIPYSFPSVLRYINNNNVAVIHLVRHNVLKTYVSREVAKRRKIYHSKRKEEIAKIRIEASKLITELRSIQYENEWWSKRFSLGDYFSLSYESFIAEKEKESRKLLSFLGINDYQELSSSNVKITPETLSDVIENFSDVENCLKGSEFAHCLD